MSNKAFKMIKTICSWFYERTVVWCIFAFFILMGWGQLKKNEISVKVKEEMLNCKIECMPNSSELFSNQCWCYYDDKTLIKSNQ